MKLPIRLAGLAVCGLVFAGPGFAQAPPVPFADFEIDNNGWWTEEHAYEMIWVDGPGETAGPGSFGAISTLVDPNGEREDDDSPESKVQGVLPEGINLADYEYISFYYRCNSEAYTGNTMFVMPMNSDWSSGAGASHGGTMIGDDQWHYEEYHMSEFANWWGEWTWETTFNLVIGIWETEERGNCEMYYDHVMLFNTPGDGILLAPGGPPEIASAVPPQGASVPKVSEITIAFNQEVQGVAADGSDLMVNGQPATAVSTTNNRIYVFSGFPNPSVGTVNVELQAGSIKSLTDDAFAGLSYSFDIFAPRGYDAPFANVAPTLDGEIGASEYPGLFINDWRPNLGGQDPVDTADWDVEWTATHDDTYLYAAFRATDDVRETSADAWAADNVELFVDGPNLKDGTGAQFRANWNGSAWESTANEAWEWAAGDTGGTTWIIEAKFLKTDHDIPATGIIGWNVQPSDNDDGTRGTYHFWADSPNNDNPWDDASSWGNAMLLPSDSTKVSDWALFE